MNIWHTIYIRYIIKTKSKTSPASRLNDNVWKDDNLKKTLGAKGPTYILIDSTIEAHDTEEISLMLWTDYDTIPNEMQDKYFYGTIKVYAWTEK